jgi:hypothetical protein
VVVGALQAADDQVLGAPYRSVISASRSARVMRWPVGLVVMSQ